jgi:hypothetical protein
MERILVQYKVQGSKFKVKRQDNGPAGMWERTSVVANRRAAARVELAQEAVKLLKGLERPKLKANLPRRHVRLADVDPDQRPSESLAFPADGRHSGPGAALDD